MPDSTPQLTNQLGQWMIYAAWIALLGLLTVAFNGYLKDQQNPNQSVNSAMTAGGVAEVTLQRNRYGHYVADGAINGKRVTFLIDTGATIISIPASVAADLSLDRGAPYQVHTANGAATVYATRLNSVTLGAIRLDGLRAAITPTMGGEEVLLGMNFMRQLEMIQRGDQMILRQRLD